ncbi:MAG: PQQ-binding-like beta-propeller repeat protein [Candidatus Micrarchaeota archaeon]
MVELSQRLFGFAILFVIMASSAGAWSQYYGAKERNPSVNLAGILDVDALRWQRNGVYGWSYISDAGGNYFYGSGGFCPGGGVCHVNYKKYDRACGNLVWQVQPGNGVYNVHDNGKEIVAIGDRVYALMEGQYPSKYYLFEMRASDGSVVAWYEIADVINTAGDWHLVTDGTRVYAFANIDYDLTTVKAFNHNTKNIDWTRTFNTEDVDKGRVFAKPVISGNQLLFIISYYHQFPYDGPTTLYSVNKDTGATLWTRQLHDPNDRNYVTHMLAYNNRLFVARKKAIAPYWEKVAAYDLSNSGNPLWGPFDNRGLRFAADTVGGSDVLYTFGDGKVRRLNANSGAIVWENSEPECVGPMTLVNGVDELLCIQADGSNQFNVARISTADGHVIDTSPSYTRSANYPYINEVAVLEDGFLVVSTSAGVLSLGGSPPTLDSITLSPASASVPVYGTQQFTATCRNSCGDTVSCPALAWTVSPAGLGTVTNNGLFTAGASPGGPGTVTASALGKSGTASITVTGLADCAVCQQDSNCVSGKCRATLEDPAVKRCVPSGQSCVLNLGANCGKATGWKQCSGNNGYYTCQASGVWSGIANCDTTSDYQGCTPPPNFVPVRADHQSPPNYCGWESQGADSCVSGSGANDGCVAPAWSGCTNPPRKCNPYVTNLNYLQCQSNNVNFCDQGCLAECDENADCVYSDQCMFSRVWRDYNPQQGTCSNQCACQEPLYSDSCRQGCGAQCDGNEDCNIYNDGCLQGTFLFRDYSTSQGTCNTDPSSCACVPPNYQDLCLPGQCGATCDENSDCNAFPNGQCIGCGCQYPPRVEANGDYAGFAGIAFDILGDAWDDGSIIFMEWVKQGGPLGSTCSFNVNLGGSAQHRTLNGQASCNMVGGYVLRLSARDNRNLWGEDDANAQLQLGGWGTVSIEPAPFDYYADNLVRPQTFNAVCRDLGGVPMNCPEDPVWTLTGFGAGTAASITPQGDPIFARFSHQSADINTADGIIHAAVQGIEGTLGIDARIYDVRVQPSSAGMAYGETETFTATCWIDPLQLNPCPGNIDWSLEGGLQGLGILFPNGASADYTAPFQAASGSIRASVGILFGDAQVSVSETGVVTPPPAGPPAVQKASIIFLSCPRLTYANETNITLQCLNQSLPCDTAGIMLTGAPNDFYGFVGTGGFVYSVETVLDGEYHLVAYAEGVGSASCTMNRVCLKEVSAPDVSPLLAVLLAPLALLLARKLKRNG